MISNSQTHLGALRRPCAGYVGTEVLAVSGGVAVSAAKPRWAHLPVFVLRQENQVQAAPPVMTIDGTSLSAPPERSP